MICFTIFPSVCSKDVFKADKAKVKGNGMVNSCIIQVEESSHLLKEEEQKSQTMKN